MDIFVVSRNGYEKIYWGERYIAGITDEAKLYGDNIVMLDPSELDQREKCAILLSSSYRWIDSVIRSNPELTPLLVTVPAWERASSVTFDYAGGVRGLLESFKSEGFSRTALVSCNPDSLNDMTKKREFVACCGVENAVYYYHQSIGERIFSEFIRDIGQYDSVICTNDIILFMLKKQLSAAGIDTADFGFATFGDRKLLKGSRVSYAFTDYYELGRSAVSCFRALVNARVRQTIAVRLDCACESVGLDGGRKSAVGSVDSSYYIEDNALFAQQIKFLLGGADEVDVELLRLAVDGCSYEEISDKLYMSINSLKRRMKSMVEAAGCQNKSELIEMMKRYI